MRLVDEGKGDGGGGGAWCCYGRNVSIKDARDPRGGGSRAGLGYARMRENGRL